jgi:hypothetical protein
MVMIQICILATGGIIANEYILSYNECRYSNKIHY